MTGADGFIGSHLVERLLREGRPVRAFVYYSSLGSWGWLDRIPSDVAADIDVVMGDLRDAESVRGAVAGCSAVLHLGALIGIPYSYQAPRSYVDTNITGTLNVLQAARETGVARVVHTSTSEVYGTPKTVPIQETHPLQGQSPYAASKIGADQMALSYYLAFGTPVTVLRPFNTFGPRQSARAVIPTVITQIAHGARSLRMGSLRPTRDFSYVDDTVSGFLAALDSKGIEGEVTNLGTGWEVSVEQTAKHIAALMGVEVEFKTEKVRVRPAGSEVERLVSDNRKAKKLLGWTPAYKGEAGFLRGLRRTIDWFVDPANLASYPRTTYTT